MKRRAYLAVVAFCALALPLTVQPAIAGTLNLGIHDIRLDVPAGWSSAKYANFHKIYSVPASDQAGLDADRLKQIVQISVHTYRAPDHAAALMRLREIASESQAAPTFLEIGGWPALQRHRLAPRPQPGAAPPDREEMVWMATTAVAVGEVAVRLEAWVPVSSEALLTTVDAIGASLTTSLIGDPAAIQREIQELRTDPSRGLPVRPTSAASPQQGVAAAKGAPESLTTAVSLPAAGSTVRVTNAGARDSELEIAVSDDGRNAVIGSNSAFFFSNDGGRNWATSAGVGSNDPSVAWGQSGGASGTFYAANISGTTTGFWTSTNAGATFTGPVAAYTCGQAGDPACGAAFPDQEHIAADRFNVTAGGDQVYSAWRHLDGNWGIVCSTDGGTTWSTNGFFVPGDLPKINVGQDGFVYVVYHPNGDDNIRLSKFNSCESNQNPMSQVFDVLVVSNPTAVACPTPGLDRCNFRNSLASPTVAVDDTNPNHVYVAYASNTNPGGGVWWPTCNDQNLCNEDIVVQDSLDGGATWLPGDVKRTVAISSGITARRFMPWVCTAGGTAYVSWYDRRAALPGGTTVSNNSLTDFFRGSAALNPSGNLVQGTEMQINELGSTDAQCEAGAATGSVASWPSPVDAQGDSESCSLQPQLGGYCCVPGEIDGSGRCLNPTAASSQAACDFNPDTCPAGEQCAARRGSPKYGDYNGSACAAGRFYMAWASATSPPALVPASTNIDVFSTSDLVCCQPQIQVPSDIAFDSICLGSDGAKTLNVCNTGKADLVVEEITSSDSQFAVTMPTGNYPVTISPDFCFPFEVTYTPAPGGATFASLTIPSNDLASPTIAVDVTGNSAKQQIVTIMDSNYGNVCLGDMKTQQLTVLNDGGCDLTINSVSITNDPGNEFSLATVMSAPFVLKAGESVSADVEFTPKGDVGAASGQVSINHNATNAPNPKVLNLAGSSPPAVIDTFIANSGSFGEVCGGDLLDLNLTVQNNGACPLQIDTATVVLGANAQAGDFVHPDGSAAGVVVGPANSVQIPIRFSPSAFDNEPPAVRMASVQVDSRTQFASSTLATDVTAIDGVVPPPDINVAIANSGDFGNVCKGDHADLDLTLFNQGKCDLTISNIQLLPDPGSFELPANLQLPLVLSPDADFTVPIRYSPTVCSDVPEARTVKITSDDPDETMVNIGVSGSSPCPNLVIDPVALSNLFAFPPTVVDTAGTLGCYSERSVNLRNTGVCPLTITSISATGVSGNPADFSVTDPTVLPKIILPSGEETLGVTVRFTPQADANPLVPDQVTGLLTVVSDDPNFPHTANLCGESVTHTGIRVLVTDVSTGSPVIVGNVDKLFVKGKGKQRPGPIKIKLKNVPVKSNMVCGNTINYHLDQETLPAAGTVGNNPKSSYSVKVKDAKLKSKQSFGIDQCEFRDFQVQLQSSKTVPPSACVLKPKGAPCTFGSECCSLQCKKGSMTCK